MKAAHTSFAQQYADAKLGFRAVPRWFRKTPFWQAREGAHRAVIDQLYQMMASERVVQHGTGIVCQRGQWAISIKALAEASGVSEAVGRRAVEHAVTHGVIAQKVLAVRMPGRTLHLSLFTWLDFDTYDLRSDAANSPPRISLNSPVSSSLSVPPRKVRHNSNTQAENTTKKTQVEERAASPPAVAGAPALSSASLDEDAQHQSGAGGEPEGPSATPTASPKSPKGKEAGKARGLTDEDKVLARSSYEMMRRYLLFGRAGLHEMDDSKLTASSTNWRVAPRVAAASGWTNETFSGLSIPQIAGVYWLSVSNYRHQSGLPLEVPDIARLIGAVKSFLRTRTKWELYNTLTCLIYHWQLIRFELDWCNPTLDEGTLQSQQVLKVIKSIVDGGDEACAARYARMNEARAA